MSTKHVDLQRRFRPAIGDEDRPFEGLFDRSDDRKPGWTGLIEKQRVVILAEAGSGKSAEFKRTRELIAGGGLFAFGASVRDVAASGLVAALTPAERARFAAWKSDPSAKCWLFIDSVDEAKDQNHHFETAVRHLADAIVGDEDRVHLYISGRFTDWDKTGDGDAIEKWLSLPDPAPPPPPDFGTEVRNTLQRKDKPAAPAGREPIEVLMMEPLSRSQARIFAEGYGVADADKLLVAIEDGDLWRFAARPLDLGWIVDYWREHKRLGTLREMIEASIVARLLDPDVRRRRADPLAAVTSSHALDRIGAGFVLCGKDTIRVPTAGLDLLPPEKSVPLEAVLPDWPDAHRIALLGRPVFDPATLGRARLHNDNKGTLRSFLSARWLARLLDRGCPIQTVHDLLFVDLYGYQLVRPDMVEVAAWLAGMNNAIADELMRRDPFSLLRDGDPGSLPIPTRVKAFTAALDRVDGADHEKLWFADEGLRRFAAVELDEHFQDWWAQAAGRKEAQHLVLRTIRIGRQHGGLPTVRVVAFDQTAGSTNQLLAGMALIVIGDPADLHTYARYVVENHATLPRSVVLNALSTLAPTHVSIAELFVLIDAVGVRDESGHATVHPLDHEVVERITETADLQDLLGGLLRRFGDLTGEETERPFRDAFSKIATVAASRLLDRFPDEVPAVVADIKLQLHEGQRYSGDDGALKSLAAKFGTSPGRRRTSFWRSVERLRTHRYVNDPGDVGLWSLQMFGWPVELADADLEWLIEDARDRTEALDRLTALRTAHAHWRQNGGGAEVLQRMTEAVANDPKLAEQLAAWQVPQEESSEIRHQTERWEAVRKQNEAQAVERDESWIELIAALRDDPSVLDHLSPQTGETVDARLFHLWQFLSWRTQSRDRYAIEDLDAVRPLFGDELTRRFGQALMQFADEHRPAGTVGEAAESRTVSNFDIMAVTGTSLAAATIPGWATKIDEERAARAARLAIMELNGLPTYLTQLAEVRPQIVRAVLLEAVEAQLVRVDPGHGMLDRLEYAEPDLSRLIVGDLADYLGCHADVPVVALDKIVSVLLRAMPLEIEGFAALVAGRVRDSADPVVAGLYLLLLFRLEANAAVDGLQAKARALQRSDQSALCCTLLPRLFGGRLSRPVQPAIFLSVRRLEQLLLIAFEAVRPEEDTVRKSLVAYSPEPRDDAQDARNKVFDVLVKTPGEAAHAALVRLAEVPDFPIEARHLRIWTQRHAEADAVLPEWVPDDVVTFERTFDRAPSTTADLQAVAVRRIERIQHDLVDGKYAQGDTLQGLVDEGAVQRWVATQFEVLQGEAYTLQREPHLADEKEPDIVLTSRHDGVELAIEIKIIDAMTVSEMEAALEGQLSGRYLRHATARHGVLLLIYQNRRPKGGRSLAGERMSHCATSSSGWARRPG